MLKHEHQHRRNVIWTAGGGALLAAAAGVAAICWPLGDGLAWLSYDVPSVFANGVPSELVLVYVDAKVKARLGEPTDVPLDRRHHARLVERLTQDNARLIFYDILFDLPAPNPGTDASFAEAIRRHGKVVLVANYDKEFQGNTFVESPMPPIAPLREAAAGWGLARLKPDPDFAIREIDGGTELYPSASWVASSLLEADRLKPGLHTKGARRWEAERLKRKWLYYYCAPVKLRAVDLDHALNPQGLDPGYFSNKIVVVAGRPSVGVAGDQREEFKNPFSRFGNRYSSGAEVHAFSLLNLLRGDWQRRAPLRAELLLVILCGILLGVALPFVRPWPAMFFAGLSVLLLFSVSLFVQHRYQRWWAWAVPATVQTPLVLVWAVGWRYLLESKRRQRLRQAFSVYVSPELADQIAQSDFNLALGGEQVEATVMFTDLAGFTAMSEKLPPKEVSSILTTYFTRTTRHILARKGTIIKFTGDGIMAVWGAPLANAHQRGDAVLAACAIVAESHSEIAGRRLRTRIGINSGPVLAGNLGSEFRFDYTAIGATTNLASRLESLNKVLGTEILISEATRQSLPEEIQVRDLGRFIVSGTTEAVGIYEVLGRLGKAPGWCGLFAEAMEHWRREEFGPAATLLEKIMALRGGQDGPSAFYLSLLRRGEGPAGGGAIKIDAK